MKIKSTFMAPMLIIAVILLTVMSRYVQLDTLELQENICLAVIVIQLLVLVVPAAFYIKLKGEGFVSRMNLRLFGPQKILATVIAAFTAIFGDMLLKLVLYNIGLIKGTYSVYAYYLNGTSPGVLYALVTFAVVPAICEELLFRSVLCAEYDSGGILTAAVASSLLYAMFGMNWGYFPIYFFIGIIFTHIMYLTRSVFASMVCHFIYCIYELVLGETVQTIITKPQSTGFLFFVMAGGFLLCLLMLMGESSNIYYGYALDERISSSPVKPGGFSARALVKAILAPPFLIAVLLFAVAAIQFEL